MIGDKEYLKKLAHARELRKEWIIALLSGLYEQADGRLVTYEGTYCCLGVACLLDPRLEVSEAYGESVFAPKNVYTSPFDVLLAESGYELEDIDEYDDPTLSWETELPEFLREEYGLSTASQSLLVAANDGGAPFAAIADIIKFLPIEIEGGYEKLDQYSHVIGEDAVNRVRN